MSDIANTTFTFIFSRITVKCLLLLFSVFVFVVIFVVVSDDGDSPFDIEI